MKITTRALILITSCCVIPVIAQFMTEHSRINPFGEAEVRKIASRLVIGMPEQEVLSMLATNGLLHNSTVHERQSWSYVYCYTNNRPDHVSSLLWLKFRQKPTPTAPLVIDGFVVWTNGILEAALINNVQIARTNTP